MMAHQHGFGIARALFTGFVLMATTLPAAFAQVAAGVNYLA
jgi:hypothetical protein